MRHLLQLGTCTCTAQAFLYDANLDPHDWRKLSISPSKLYLLIDLELPWPAAANLLVVGACCAGMLKSVLQTLTLPACRRR